MKHDANPIPQTKAPMLRSRTHCPRKFGGENSLPKYFNPKTIKATDLKCKERTPRI